MTTYQKPMALTRAFNRLTSWLASRGLTPSRTVTLEVKGRSSGEPRAAVINFVEYEGQRYFVSTRGESEWVRNVRAAGGRAFVRHRGRRRVRLEEVPAGERAPILKKYLGENVFTTKRNFGVEPDAPLEEFERIAEQHPAFRVAEEES